MDQATVIREALEAEAARNHPDVDIVAVTITGSKRSPIVQVLVDWQPEEDKDGITLDEVAEQSRWIDAVLDEVDPFENAYSLEVSSPGIERPLTRVKDFARFVGERCFIQLDGTEGRRKYTGTIAAVGEGEDPVITVTCDGQDFEIPFHRVKKAQLKPEITF